MKVLSNLDKPLTPTQLSEKIQTHRSTTSRTLLELEDKGLVKCVTPDENMGRLYKITEQGKKIIEEINRE